MKDPENELALQKFLSNSQEQILFVSKKEDLDQAEIQCSVTVADVKQDFSETMAFYKRGELDVDKILKKRDYLKGCFSVMMVGELREDFDIMHVFNETLQNGLIPMLHQYKTQGKFSEELELDQRKNQFEGSQFNNIYKKFTELQGIIQQKIRTSEVPTVRFEVNKKIEEIVERVPDPSLADIPAELMQDQDFLENLSEFRLKWANQTQILMNYGKDYKVNSIMDEVSFWINYVKSLEKLQLELFRPEVRITQQILQFNKKPHEICSSQEFRDLKTNAEFIEKVMISLNFNQILVSLKSDENKEIKEIFGKMKKLIEKPFYPNQRLKNFVQTLHREFNQKTADLIRETDLLSMDFEKLKETLKQIHYFPLNVWEYQLDRIKECIRPARHLDITKNTDIVEQTKAIFNRLEKIQEIKTAHEQLSVLYKQTFENEAYYNSSLFQYNFPGGKDLEKEFEVFKGLDIMDLSPEGEQKLRQAQAQYAKRTTELDKRIVEKIHAIHKKPLSDEEKYQIFCKFASLQKRPYIKQELQAYQDNLIQVVKGDVARLNEKFKSQQNTTKNSLVAKKYKISSFINITIWTEQILNVLNQNTEKLRMVLGEDWETQPKGKEIHKIWLNFSQQIQSNIQEIIKYCENKYKNKKDEKILSVRKNPETDALQLHVNVNSQNREVIKAIKLLFLWNQELNKKYLLKFMFRRVAWPSYTAFYMIKISADSFNNVAQKLDETCLKLMAKSLRLVYAKLEQSINYTWYLEIENQEENVVEKFALSFFQNVHHLEKNTEYLQEKTKAINGWLAKVKQSEQKEIWDQGISEIQNIVLEFESKDFQNLDSYIAQLNESIQETLIQKLQLLVLQWNYEFVRMENYSEPGFDLESHKLINFCTQHEIKVQNQQISLDPPLESTRLYWMHNLQKIISGICSLKKIRRRRELSLEKGALHKEDHTFQGIAQQLPVDTLVEAFDSLQECIERVEHFVQGWKHYQALWELDVKKVYDFLGENADMWEGVLNEITEGKKQFADQQTFQRFGPIVIQVRIAQRKISNKYHALHTEILSEFGKNLANEFNEFSAAIAQKREEVEAIDFHDSSNIIKGISKIRECRDSMEKWANTIDRFGSGEQLLKEQKFEFPKNWKEFYIVESEWNRFQQSFNYQNALYKKEYESLKGRLLKEEAGLVAKVHDIEKTWSEKKPYSGALHPREALEVINSLEKKISENKQQFEQVNAAKELLELPPLDLTTINTIIEDSSSLKEMWAQIDQSWRKVDKIMETQMQVANPIKFHATYDEILEELNSLPNKFRTYEALVSKKKEIQELKKVNKLLKDMKTEAMKDHHWESLLKRIKLMKKYRNLTVGDVYKHKLLKYEKAINEALHSAQGELVLEHMLKKIKDFWTQEEFDLGQYQEKCMLIRGWDDMMTQIEDDIAQISSMKLSQHYKTFEEEIKGWNDKLTVLQAVLDVWVNVQKKWVYLEGIFFGSSDISQQLPTEYARFKSIDNDFTSLMKKTAARRRILDVCLNIPNLEKSLRLLYDQLEKIQKALSEYLETQRQAFARFYFVGDEDLLEIIGNSKEVTNIQKFFSKMFAGLNFVEHEDAVLLKGMRSRQNETVPFINPFNISDYKKINEWLDELENQMKLSLADQFETGVAEWARHNQADIRELVEKYCAQVVLLSFQAYWTFLIEGGEFKTALDKILATLDFMAEAVLTDLPKLTRSKYEQLITEFVHKRDATRSLQKQGEQPSESFYWFSQMKYFALPDALDKAKGLEVHLGNSRFSYGYEYLGIAEKLVQTPLTDKCYFTLTQALWLRMGGAPFGPAGTGKTESVKMLGATLGRFVLVFNCDETFNFKAMGRIFIGLCQVGAWGCFDEFNRLEERILSAVSQQILTIQMGLREDQEKIALMSKEVKLNVNMGIFVTMNPGYAGRSNLPENLKQLFRQMAMIKPDRELIAQVMLFSQGFKSAEQLSGKVVSLFELCADQLSSQPHYDFGLRALKSVLNSAGTLKRKAISKDAEKANQPVEEQKIILRSFCDTVVPKLISQDAPLLESLIKGVFPLADVPKIEDLQLREAIAEECVSRNLLRGPPFVEKILQLNQILKLQHGIMLVGPTGCGKSAAWRVLLEAQTKLDGVKGESYVIDPKAITKEGLYGVLDDTTMEWTDGIFTHILRKINENARGESHKRHWIVFDGDVDPEWVENLNSVLDDNKLLTLPNGERLSIPSNVKIMFEVESLKWATLATVSRCGMVWFSNDVLNLEDVFYNYLMRLKLDNFDEKISQQGAQLSADREQCVKAVEILFFGGSTESVVTDLVLKIDTRKSLVYQALLIANKQEHVMSYSHIRVLEAFFTLIRRGIERVVEYNTQNSDTPLEERVITQFMRKWALIALVWSFVGDTTLQRRSDFYEQLQQQQGDNLGPISLPQTNDKLTLIDYTVDLESGNWVKWTDRVPEMDIDQKDVNNASLIITTVDTLRHQEVLCSWLVEKRPFIICGPPGSGKTMTLMSTLRSLPDYDMIFVNFSSSTTPGMILKQFEHYCEYIKSTKGITLKPKQFNKKLVVFCDEINLPDEDQYGTQSVITFLRQMTEQRGFWRGHDHQWITLEDIQFVGACNPPTDAGRHPLAPRFMRHCPLMLVDFPGYQSLTQIYGTFNKAMLKPHPELKNKWEQLTKAMVEYYSQSQRRFTSDQHAHYIYSPRELTRWKYALYEGLESVESMDDLVRLWAHEALRLFEDRLVTEDEKVWCQEALDRIARECFTGVGYQTALERPILFSTYLTKAYKSVQLEELRGYVTAKLQKFNEEEYEIQLVVFDAVLDHILRIDRVLRQPIGHLLLVGASGVGKTTLSRFVSWMNGLKVFQIKAGLNYSLADFDANLRDVMKMAGCKKEKITFIFDESNVLGVAFLERMNALLASGEVPGLFEGEEYLALINQYKENQENSKRIESEEEIYANFTKNVQRNLHVVFTMNPANPDFSNRAASSPAIFNRCVIDWFGDWSSDALHQVARELTENLDIPDNSLEDGQADVHDTLVLLLVRIHHSVSALNDQLRKGAKRFNYMTPRDFLDFIRHTNELHVEKKEVLQEQQVHLNKGLSQLQNTEEKVEELDASLKTFREELAVSQSEATAKMNVMIEQQKNAEEKQKKLEELAKVIKTKSGEIAERQIVVQKELDKAGPALEKARSAVGNLKKDKIGQIKVLKNPPEIIKGPIVGVCFLLRQKELDFKDCVKVMMDVNFIKDVKSIDQKALEKIPTKIFKKLKKNYADKSEDQIKKIRRAFGPAGDLAEWLTSTVMFGDILTQVEPLTLEIKTLKEEEEKLVIESEQNQKDLEETEKKVKALKEEYSLLIKRVSKIKSDMEKVNTKVETSKKLLLNLSSEKSRWTETSNNFSKQLSTVTGDVILSSAFLAYCGFFDQLYRNLLLKSWKSYLRQCSLKFKENLSVSEFLSKPSERMLWQSHGLPNDDLCSQNAIIIKRHNRYPLVIDPSGQAQDFLLSHHKEHKIEKTDFSEPNFLKVLEKCLRFGLPVLVRNVERVNPMMNSLLNKEVVKQAGRILVRVGDQEIDFNKNFVLFMITRNAEAKFTPDLCSRVTFVNFTVTQSSLENQCINLYLKHERPDIEKKRLDLLKLQGEYLVRLRALEDDLLTKISEQQGNILENEPLIKTLETLKVQAQEIKQQMQESGEVLKEVDNTTAAYRRISFLSAKIYFTLQQFSDIKKLYQFSFQFYMKILMQLLADNAELKAIPATEYDQRIATIERQLFIMVYAKIENAILAQDKLVIALKFCQLKLGDSYGEEFKAMFEPTAIVESSWRGVLDGIISKQQLILLENLSKSRLFAKLKDSLVRDESEWSDFITKRERKEFPKDWFETNDKVTSDIVEILIANVLKPSVSFELIRSFIEDTMGKEFFDTKLLDLDSLIYEDASNHSPIFFSSAPGFDPSYKITDVAKKNNKSLSSVAIGSAEGFAQAEKDLDRAMKSGSWVVFKNVHLACSWLKEVEQKILKSKPNLDFRCFFVSEFSDKIPTTLLRVSAKALFELPDGIKANVTRNLQTVLSPEQMDASPWERGRIYFQVVWLHAVIMERLRYTPIGWSKSYEFSEADLRSTLEIVDQFLAKADDPLKTLLPLRSIITNNVYGGKVDNKFDLLILESLVDQYMSDSFFTNPQNTPFVSEGSQVIVGGHDERDHAGYLAWVRDLKTVPSPVWAGLPFSAEDVLKKQNLKVLLSKMLTIQDVNEEEIEDIKEEQAEDAQSQLKWLKELGERCSKYLGLLPNDLPLLQRNKELISNPLFRFLEREVTVCSKLLKNVRKVLQNLIDMVEGKLQPLQYLKNLAFQIYQGTIPKDWKKYVVPTDIDVAIWIRDFKKRLEQLQRFCKIKDWQRKGVNVGLMLFPEAFLTASRQFVAQNKKCSLDNLELRITRTTEEEVDVNSFLVKEMKIEGVNWTDSGLELHQNISFPLPNIKFEWKECDSTDVKALKEGEIFIPVYLNRQRQNLLTPVKFDITRSSIQEQVLYQRGIAFIVWDS